MKAKQRRGGFTLIEVLIVVVIMAVLAATIIPQFTSSAKDARESSAKFNLHTLRSTIDMYKLHHRGVLPAADKINDQLTKATSETGTVGTPGPSFPYGPYIQGALPNNPFNNLNTVTEYTAATAPVAADATGTSGWLYRPATGDIWINHADLIAQ